MLVPIPHCQTCGWRGMHWPLRVHVSTHERCCSLHPHRHSHVLSMDQMALVIPAHRLHTRNTCHWCSSDVMTCDPQDDSKAPQCCLCPIEGGALKPTTEPGLWCHATCMHWIPEVSAVDERRMEPVTGIKSIQKERWELNCCICKYAASQIVSKQCKRLTKKKKDLFFQGIEEQIHAQGIRSRSRFRRVESKGFVEICPNFGLLCPEKKRLTM